MDKPNYFPLPAFLREKQILFGDPTIKLPQLMCVGRTRWWHGVKVGHFPRPIKLSSKTTVWKGCDIEEMILRLYAK